MACLNLLGLRFRHFACFNRTYGTRGGLVAFMVWLYWPSFVLLVGAELNAELAKESRKGGTQPKQLPPQDDKRAIFPPVFDRAA
jgi:membrane protein